LGWVGLDLYVCGLGWVVGYENGPMDNSALDHILHFSGTFRCLAMPFCECPCKILLCCILSRILFDLTNGDGSDL